MKVLNCLCLCLVFAFFACSEVDPSIKEVESKVENDKKPLSSTVSFVTLGEDNAGVLSITYAPLATLESELETYWGLTSLSNLRIEILGASGDYVLLGDGNKANGDHVDWGLTLDRNNDDINLAVGGSVQSCSSKDCCSGCKFNYVSEFEGSCDCSSPIATCEEGKTPNCAHSITVGTLSRDALVQNLANAQQ